MALFAALLIVLTAAACDPGADKPVDRAHAAVNLHVPQRLRDAIHYQVEIVGGYTSTAAPNGHLRLSKYHMTGSWDDARFVMMHEYGHLVAWRYGTGAFNGAGPSGFPYTGAKAEEVWADCFAMALTDYRRHTVGHVPCPANALQWTRNWINFWFR